MHPSKRLAAYLVLMRKAQSLHYYYSQVFFCRPEGLQQKNEAEADADSADKQGPEKATPSSKIRDEASLTAPPHLPAEQPSDSPKGNEVPQKVDEAAILESSLRDSKSADDAATNGRSDPSHLAAADPQGWL